MTENKKSLASPLARMSTGLRMFLILSFWLLPLGALAILASVEIARENNIRRTEQALTRLEIKARRIDTLIAFTSNTMSAANIAISLTPGNSPVCQRTLGRLVSNAGQDSRFALFADGKLRCSTPGYMPAPPPPVTREGVRVRIAEDGQMLQLIQFGGQGQPIGMGEISRAHLSRLTYIAGTSPIYDLGLFGAGRTMELRKGYEGGPLVHTVRGNEAVANRQLQLRMELSAIPLSPAEILIILIPVMIWIAASVFAWLIVDQLLLRPLLRMRRAIAAYSPGDIELDLPPLSTFAREISELGFEFQKMTKMVARHEADLEAAIEQQKKLVREVHHRVKNNLQVVASLLNLHARGEINEDVAAAYASIQRRVDALAVVHRNHYAELEANRGVSLRSLIAELGTNLRATAPAAAATMQIRLDIEPYHVTQDIAVSVAFLITEVVEYSMLCGAEMVTIFLAGAEEGAARLTIDSESLNGATKCDPKITERFEKIVTGLSRQLRTTITHDPGSGRFSLPIAILD